MTGDGDRGIHRRHCGNGECCLGAERRAEERDPVVVRTEGIDLVDEQFERHLVRRRALTDPTEPADRAHPRAVSCEHLGAVRLDPAARPGQQQHRRAVGLGGVSVEDVCGGDHSVTESRGGLCTNSSRMPLASSTNEAK